MATKSDFFQKTGRRYVEKHGVWIRSLTELERINIRGAWAKRAKDIKEDDKDAWTAQSEMIDAELLVTVIVDGDGGGRVFKDSDVEELRENMDAVIFTDLATLAFEHCFNSNSRKVVDANEKKSDAPADSN